MAGKYDHIDFKPPQSVADAAARGLELRKKNKGKGGLSSGQANKAGVGSGVQRATNLKNRNNLSPSTVKRMKAFFDRHKGNEKASGGKPLSQDKGYISFMLWGGNPGRSWANKVVRQMEAADKKSKRANQYADKFNLPRTKPNHLSNIHALAFKLKQAKLDKWAEDVLESIEEDMKTLLDCLSEDEEQDARDLLPGGLADGMDDSEFDPHQLAKGIQTELEHTNDVNISKEIAKDHLMEIPTDYYDRLEKMEEEAERDGVYQGEHHHAALRYKRKLLK